MSGKINISPNHTPRRMCGVCESMVGLLQIEIGDFIRTETTVICQKCAEELKGKLEKATESKEKRLSVLSHYDDGKGKGQSHEISSQRLDEQFDVFLHGYGSSKDEAYSEFLAKVDRFSKEFTTFKENLSLDNTIEVDTFGKPASKEK